MLAAFLICSANIRSSDSYYDLKENIGNVLYKLPKGDKIVGAIKKTKSNLKQVILHDSMFESMGIYYLGPVDGHDIEKLIKVLHVAKRINGASSCPCCNTERARI